MKTKIDQATEAVIEQIIDFAVHYRIGPLQGSNWKSVLPLLRAAPDLLAAARTVLANAEPRGETVDDEGEPYEDFQALRAAIAKATSD